MKALLLPPTLVLALALTLALTAPAAKVHAALWGFVDGKGVAHFSSAQKDPRYQLLLPERAAAAPAQPRVPGKADGAASVLLWLDIAPEVKAVTPWLREAARLHGVDTELLKAVIAVESGFNAKAVSPKGALGLMQITRDAAERYATAVEKKTPAEQRLLDPRTNILTGARMLADLTRRFTRIDHALAAWSAGEGAVRRAGGVPAIEETQAHVHLVLELYWALLQDSQAARATRIELK